MIARVEKKPVDEASESSLPVCSSFGLTSGKVANAMNMMMIIMIIMMIMMIMVIMMTMRIMRTFAHLPSFQTARHSKRSLRVCEPWTSAQACG